MGAVVGSNIKRVRQARRQTQVEAAHFLRERGLAWTRDHLNNVELGRRPVLELDVLLLLSWAYDVPPAEWFAGDGEVALSPTVSAPRGVIRAALSEKVGALTLHGELAAVVADKVPVRKSADVRWSVETSSDAPMEADTAVAGRLGVKTEAVTGAARGLWSGRTVTQERDRRLGDLSDRTARSVQARRGAMTRTLTVEIGHALGLDR